MEDMISYSEAAMERAMKVEEVILRAIARKINWWQAAEIIGISDRQMRRWRQRYEEFEVRGLYDRRRGKPLPKRGTCQESCVWVSHAALSKRDWNMALSW